MAAAFVGAAAVGAAAVAPPHRGAAAVGAPAARRAVAAARTRRVAGGAASGGGRRGGVTMETLVWAPVGPASAVSAGATPFEAVGLALTLVATVRGGGGVGWVERWAGCFLWVPLDSGEGWNGPAGERVGARGRSSRHACLLLRRHSPREVAMPACEFVWRPPVLSPSAAFSSVPPDDTSG